MLEACLKAVVSFHDFQASQNAFIQEVELLASEDLLDSCAHQHTVGSIGLLEGLRDERASHIDGYIDLGQGDQVLKVLIKVPEFFGMKFHSCYHCLD